MNKMHLVGAALIAAFLTSSPLQADNNLKTSGFATIAVSQTDSKYPYVQGEYDKFNFRSSSLAGIQFDFTVNEDTSFVAQILGTATSQWEPAFSWAFFKYKLTPNTAVRAGRMPTPGYMLSDYVNVGYAYPWISPPSEIYDTGSDGAIDGMDAIFRGSLTQSWSFYVRPYMGSNQESGANSDEMLGVEFNISSDNITLAASYRTTTITATDEFPLYQLVDVFGPQPNDDYKPIGAHVDSYDAGLTYDNGSLLVMTEINAYSWAEKVLLPTTRAGYVMAGWRFGKVMPHITYSKMKTDEDKFYQFDPNVGAGATINQVIKNFLDRDQETVTVGVRWDFRPNVALKAEYQRIKGFDGGSGLFPPNPSAPVVMDDVDPEVNLFRIALTGAF